MAVERPARPVIEMKIEPKSKADEPAILLALTAMASLDPTFVVSLDPESREIILKGCGERHLNRKIEQLRQFHGIDFNLGAQQVVYLEALRGSAGVDYSVSMPTGRSRMFARVTLHLQFVDLDLGNEFISDVAPDEAWDQYVHAVEIGVRQVWDCGVLIGFPIVNSRVTLLEVGFLEDESSPMAFQAAARAAMKEGWKA